MIRPINSAFKGAVFRISDLHFAAALRACGVPMAAEPKLLDCGTGGTRCLFLFHARNDDGTVDVSKCSSAMQDPAGFIARHPNHPVSYALAGILSFAQLTQQAKNTRPVVTLRTPGSSVLLHLTKDSRKYHAALKRGCVPVTATAPQETVLETLCKVPPPNTHEHEPA